LHGPSFAKRQYQEELAANELAANELAANELAASELAATQAHGVERPQWSGEGHFGEGASYQISPAMAFYFSHHTIS
jgi:hypothetical protein